MQSPKTLKVIEKFKAVHGETYDYSRVVYVVSKRKVEIVCREHGGFLQTPQKHMLGQGCPICSKIRTPNYTNFVAKALAMGLTSEEVENCGFTGMKDKIKRVCTIHGEYYTQAKAFIHRGDGCPACGHEITASKKTKTVEQVIEGFRSTHGNRYDYSKVVYVKGRDKVEIICRDHGSFWQAPETHTQGVGCPICGALKASSTRMFTTAEFIIKAQQCQVDYNIDYTNFRYNGWKVEHEFICKLHGSFYKTPENHIKGAGCPECGIKSRKDSRVSGGDILNRFLKAHGDVYGYPEPLEGVKIKDKITIVCPIHGEFLKVVGKHAEGQGCPKCSCIGSKGERDLYIYVKDLGVGVRGNDRKVLGGRELDIYVKSHKLAIEYNGLFWHSEANERGRFHLQEKYVECRALGISLLHVMESDNPTVIKKLIASRLGYDDETIGARKCSVVVGTDARDLYNNNHVQGNVAGCVVYSLYYRGQMVAAMSFSSLSSIRGQKKDDRLWELRRFATVCKVPGGASKLLKAFLNNNPQCEEIISYSDNRLFSGGMYGKLGFELVSESGPDYKYTKNGALLPKGLFKRSCLVKMKGFDFRPEETELENCKRNGWWRVWDCGKKKWSLKVK
jgi:hypothetical protein